MNSFGFCHLSVSPLRKEPSDKEEMVNQLLFGEVFEILEEKDNWWYIKTLHDDYPGWLDKKQGVIISGETLQKVSAIKPLHTTELVQLIFSHSQRCFIPLVIGSVIPYLNNKVFFIDDKQYTYEGDTCTTGQAEIKKILDTAQMYQHAPYLWGGKTPFGIDCSGFIQMVFKINGINLKRDAHQQAVDGETISFISDAQSADVVFFDNEEGHIIHAGLIVGKNKIMHACGKVRIDSIDHYGIFNYDTNKYTHKLRLIKRYVNEQSEK